MPKIILTGFRSRGQQAWSLLESPLESLFSPLPASRPSVGSQPQLSTHNPSCHVFLVNFNSLAPPPYKDSCDHSGATQIIKNKLSISRP